MNFCMEGSCYLRNNNKIKNLVSDVDCDGGLGRILPGNCQHRGCHHHWHFHHHIFSSILTSLLANTDLNNVANPGVQLQPGRRVETGGFSHILKNFWHCHNISDVFWEKIHNIFVTIFARSIPFHLVGMDCEGFPLPTSSMSLVMIMMTIMMIVIIPIILAWWLCQ